MKKIIIIALIALLNASFACAKSLVLTLSDGSSVYYQLGGDTEPVLRFSASGVVIEADSYQFSEFSNFVISDNDKPTGVDEVEVKAPSFQDGKIVIPSVYKNIQLYDCNGSQCQADVTTTDEYSSLDMSSLSAGIYIVKVGNNSFKILCK